MPEHTLSPEDRGQLEELKARYFRFADLKQWDEFGQLFTVDGVLEIPELGFRAEGRTAIVTGVRQALETAVSIHHGHTAELAKVDANHASGIWPMEDHIVWERRKDGRLETKTLHGHGHYVERYRLEDGGWKIEHSYLVRLRVESTVVRCYPDAAQTLGARLTAP